MSEHAAVYRLYDAAGVLLYVGVAARPESRWKQHALAKRWWPEVARRDVQWCADRQAALKAEAAAIREEGPLYNTVVPQADGSVRGALLRTDVPEIARGTSDPEYRKVRIEDDLWERFGAAVKRADPDANRAAVLRRMARWFVGDVDQEPTRPPAAGTR